MVGVVAKWAQEESDRDWKDGIREEEVEANQQQIVMRSINNEWETVFSLFSFYEVTNGVGELQPSRRKM